MNTRKPMGNARRRAGTAPSVASARPMSTTGSDSARSVRLPAAMPTPRVASPAAIITKPLGSDCAASSPCASASSTSQAR